MIGDMQQSRPVVPNFLSLKPPLPVSKTSQAPPTRIHWKNKVINYKLLFAKINNSCRFLLLFSLFYNVYRYISSFFVSSGVSHTNTHTQFTYLPAYLIAVLVINSLMNLNVNQKYIQFDFWLSSWVCCWDFIHLMCTSIILVTSQPQSRQSCAPPLRSPAPP